MLIFDLQRIQKDITEAIALLEQLQTIEYLYPERSESEQEDQSEEETTSQIEESI